jgi:hypothetical protein
MEQTTEETNPNVTGKEAYEARKAQKNATKGESVREREQSTNSRNYVLYIVGAIAIAGFVYWIVSGIVRSVPQSDDVSLAIPSQGSEHIAVGSEHEPYNSNPPTSGPHYEQPARAGFREEAIADEHLVHSLEHGLVWVSYHPSLPTEVIGELRQFANDSMVVITAREANDTDIALATWTRLDKFDMAEEDLLGDSEVQRIRDFITRYRNSGPEKIPAGSHGGI